MQSCRHCSRTNPAEAIYCRECGRPLAPETTGDDGARSDPPAAASDASSPTLPRVAAAGREERAASGGPSRVAVLVVGILGLVALAAGTGIKMATHQGRSVPPIDPKLRALPPPTISDDGSDATDTQRPPARAEPALSTEPAATPIANRVEAKKPETKAAPQPETKVAPQPERKVAPPKPLGPPPSESEIRTCINRRRARVRTCADEAAQRMEDVGGGTARATLNPSGAFTNIRVPGYGYFASCATRIIRGLRCRAYRGGPVEVAYPLRY